MYALAAPTAASSISCIPLELARLLVPRPVRALAGDVAVLYTLAPPAEPQMVSGGGALRAMVAADDRGVGETAPSLGLTLAHVSA